MALHTILRVMRLSLLRLPAGKGRAPTSPAYILRDLWPGSSINGMHLVRGEFIYKDQIIPLKPGQWGGAYTPTDPLCQMHGFAWLRDMRELGTDNARLSARALVADWIKTPFSSLDPVAYRPDVLGMRLTNWLGLYDFFAASADDVFRRSFMKRALKEGRYALAMLPPDPDSSRAFTLLKGVMVLALCSPERVYLLGRVTRYLQKEILTQILNDGLHIERNPEIQLAVLQDLVEMRLMYQLMDTRPPNELISALDAISRALRSLRHGDGGLALFNGSCEANPHLIDRILSHATQKRVAMTNMTEGGYVRCYANRATLLVDSGAPTKIVKNLKHAGVLSLEFSVGKQRVFVNCGSGGNSQWKSMLSCTAAHSVLELEQTDSVEFKGGKTKNPDFEATAKHQMQDGSHLLELEHNGWLKNWGATYQRKLYLSSNGEDLRGEERINADRDLSFVIRFHLHPSISIEEETMELTKGKEERVYVLLANNKHEGRQIWWFRFSGAKARVEESVYFGEGHRIASKQIVLYVNAPKGEPKLTSEVESKSEVVPLVEETIIKDPSITDKKDSDYVAILHTSDADQTVGQDSSELRLFKELSKKHSEEEKEEVGAKKKHQIVQWALHRKL